MSGDMQQMYKMLKICSEHSAGKLTLDNLCSKIIIDYIDNLNNGIDELINKYKNDLDIINDAIEKEWDYEIVQGYNGQICEIENIIEDLSNFKKGGNHE